MTSDRCNNENCDYFGERASADCATCQTAYASAMSADLQYKNLAFQVSDLVERQGPKRAQPVRRGPNFKIVKYEDPMFLRYWPDVWAFLGDVAALFALFAFAYFLLCLPVVLG